MNMNDIINLIISPTIRLGEELYIFGLKIFTKNSAGTIIPVGKKSNG